MQLVERAYTGTPSPLVPLPLPRLCARIVFHIWVSIPALDLNRDLEKRGREEQRERTLVPESDKGWHTQGRPSAPEFFYAGSSFHRVEDIVSTLITITVS